ncbi:malonyl CoA-acyl carrier protein transacylase [Caldimonas brevitalea]|uniref:Malonyl CoA-acyl carrier protein transacylase n=1 Tax=Caldimonas brevitalea TaxID=413882 RepID=A0A0G3BSG2_9BURK|nr:malonyl CoA-acyl carrier protein transacylase [Caldimonas brevitalea]
MPETLLKQPNFIKRRPLLKACDRFDAKFFGYTDIEAEALDPQLRLLLQCAWRALEEAGAVSTTQRQRAGLFAGLRQSRYLDEHLLASQRHCDALGADYLQMINRKDSAATLLAYKLDLGGPAISVNTACSTSLLAVHLACNSLLSFECDVALAGGAAIPAFGPDGHLYVPGGFLSADGRCRPFSDDAGGTIDGAGVGLVALKRLSDARRDGNLIHAVILGSAVNNDGADKVGYTAPSVSGQARVIADALALADVSPETIGYVETHGTGTRLGDPIEIRALTQAWRQHTSRSGYCHLGSAKANVGHLGAAAGVVGLIKATLAVREGHIPPLANHRQPNPQLELETSPFRVPLKAIDWPAADGPRRAAVSSFGIGGTNVHMIVEQAPAPLPRPAARATTTGERLFVLSAKSPAALADTAAAIAAAVTTLPPGALDDLGFTLRLSRAHLPWRTFVVADRATTLASRWQALPLPAAASVSRPRTAFLFPGQGSQHRGMTLALRDRLPAYRDALDRAAALVRQHAGFDLLDLLQHADDAALTRTDRAQPALFATSYALAAAWQSLGVQPEALLGHSVGELVAACVAGVFSLEDGVRLVCERGRLMQAAPHGAMLAVLLPAAELAPLLPASVELAVINGKAACVVGAETGAIESMQAALTSRGIGTRRLHTSHAFHTAAMEEAAQRFADVVGSVPLSAPRLPVISNLTGELLRDDQARSPQYWSRQLRSTVQFERGLAYLASMGVDCLVEVGAGTTLTGLARTELPKTVAIASQPHPTRLQESPSAAVSAFLQAAGELWARGVELDLAACNPPHPDARQVPLPGYQFERQRHWVEANPRRSETPSGQAPLAAPALQKVTLQPLLRDPAASQDDAATPFDAHALPADLFRTLAARGLPLLAAPETPAAAVLQHDPHPVEAALLALACAPSPAAAPAIVANFELRANQEALPRHGQAAKAAVPLLLLEGQAFLLALQEAGAVPGASVSRLGHLVGWPEAWQQSLHADFTDAQDADLPRLHLARLADAAPRSWPAPSDAGVSRDVWLLVDEPGPAAPERLDRLRGARDALQALGWHHVVWLVLRRPLTPDALPELARSLPAIAADGSVLYLGAAGAPDQPSLAGPQGVANVDAAATPDPTNATDPKDVRGVIRDIWRQVLGVDQVGLDDNFFDLGGNSLWALQIVSRVNSAFGCELHLSELLHAATVNDLSALVESKLLSDVDDGELSALLEELGDLPEEEALRLLQQS